MPACTACLACLESRPHACPPRSICQASAYLSASSPRNADPVTGEGSVRLRSIAHSEPLASNVFECGVYGSRGVGRGPLRLASSGVGAGSDCGTTLSSPRSAFGCPFGRRPCLAARAADGVARGSGGIRRRCCALLTPGGQQGVDQPYICSIVCQRAPGEGRVRVRARAVSGGRPCSRRVALASGAAHVQGACHGTATDARPLMHAYCLHESTG